jgi:hypothetical protein
MSFPFEVKGREGLMLNRALQAAAHELERQKVTDSLRKGLEKRPQREDLVERESFPPL